MYPLKKIVTRVRTSFLDAVNNFKTVKIKYWWCIILSAALHRLPFAILPQESMADLKRACLILSYILLFWSLSHNLNFKSVRLMAVGTLINFLGIVANGGLMPVSPQARELAKMTSLDPSQFGMVLPEGSGVYLPIEQTNLWFFTDIIPAHSLGGVYSAGDLLIAFGFFLFFMEVAFSKNRTVEPNGSGPTGDDLIVRNKIEVMNADLIE
jgi:hypothetical protein